MLPAERSTKVIERDNPSFSRPALHKRGCHRNRRRAQPGPGTRCLPLAGLLAGLAAMIGITACTSSPPIPADHAERQQHKDNEILNMQLAAAASRREIFTNGKAPEYRIGPGDVLEITVFQVEELNLKVRVNGRGTVIVPLLGEIDVGNKTVVDMERLLAEKLGENYLHDPQVSVFVSEYRSQKITVMGAVKEPAVHIVRRPHSVLELLSMSGGLNEKAGHQIYVQTLTEDAKTKDATAQNLIIELKKLLENTTPEFNLILRGGDSVYVPEAGVVFVEGAVRKPGAYQMHGETNVLKAIALAGGVEFDAKEGSIQVFRRGAGDDQVVEVDLKAIRDNRVTDLRLLDGDIVVVRSNILKKGFVGSWRGVTGVFSVNKGI